MPRAVITAAFDYEMPGQRAMKAFQPTNGQPINVSQAELDAILAKGAGHEVPVDGKALPNARAPRAPRAPKVVAEPKAGDE